jgi:hypothetical protein
VHIALDILAKLQLLKHITDTVLKTCQKYSTLNMSQIEYFQHVTGHHRHLSWSWATCWPVPVSRIQKSLQRSAMIPSVSCRIHVTHRYSTFNMSHVRYYNVSHVRYYNVSHLLSTLFVLNLAFVSYSKCRKD